MPNFIYESGKLISHPEVSAIFANVTSQGLTNWVDPYNQPMIISDVCRMTSFLRDLVDSAFMDLIGQEYSANGVYISRGKFLGTFFAPVAAGHQTVAGLTEVADADIRKMIVAEITNGNIPPANNNSCYFVFLPVNTVTVSPFGRSDNLPSPVQGYHSAIQLTSGQNVYYAVIAYDISSSAITVSHELAELVTNPEGFGWTATRTTSSNIIKEEIADVCFEPVLFHGEFISQFWSRSLGRCASPTEDGRRKPFARNSIEGGTCLGHAIEGVPLNLSLRVAFVEPAQQQPFPFYFWTTTDGTVIGSNRQAQFVVLPPMAPSTIQISVVTIDQLGCSNAITREFRIIAKSQAVQEDQFCELIKRLQTTATIVFRPDPLWDPLKDLITRPVVQKDIEAMENVARDLYELAHLLKENQAAARSKDRNQSS